MGGFLACESTRVWILGPDLRRFQVIECFSPGLDLIASHVIPHVTAGTDADEPVLFALGVGGEVSVVHPEAGRDLEIALIKPPEPLLRLEGQVSSAVLFVLFVSLFLCFFVCCFFVCFFVSF